MLCADVAIFIFGTVSSGFFGVWTGRCWQRAIDAEKTLDALALKYEMSDTVDEEFEEVEKLLMEYAERLEEPTSTALNEVLNEGVNPNRSTTEPDTLYRDAEPVREGAVSESDPAADPHSDHGE